MGYHLPKVFVLVILATCTPNANAAAISEEKKTAIEEGLEAGKDLADVLKDGNFRDSLVKLVKNLAPFLGVLGPLHSIALSFIPSGTDLEEDSEELKLMEKEFSEINNKLDSMTLEFKELNNGIYWNAVGISYGPYERTIGAAEANLNSIYKFQGSKREYKKDKFIKQYDRDSVDNAVQKLYDAIMKNDHFISKTILAAVVKHTKNHKRKVEQFSLGLVQLLVRGIKVKVSYYAMKSVEGWTAEDEAKFWTKKMISLKDRLQRLSDEVKGRYKTQLKTDTDDLVSRHHDLDNKALMVKIYDFVTEKYDWRYWFVAVYDDICGYDNHAISLCGGYSLLHENGKNIVISSQDKINSSRFKQSDAANLLKGVENDINECSESLRNPGDRARALVDNVRKDTGKICVPYALVMAVRTGEGLAYSPNATDHEARHKIEKTKTCCLHEDRVKIRVFRGYGCQGRRRCRYRYECRLYGRPISCSVCGSNCDTAYQCTRYKPVSWHHDMIIFG